MNSSLIAKGRAQVVFVLLAASIVSFWIGCAKRTPNAANESVTLGAVLPMTGDAANYGKSLRLGLELARDQINHEGGINGANLEILYEDSAADAVAGSNAFRKLVDVNHVPLVFGSISGVVLTLAPLADEKKVVLINSSAISPKITEQATGYLFNLMVSGRDEAVFAAHRLARICPNGVGVIYSNNASGKDTMNVFTKVLSDDGGHVQFAEGYELKKTDFRQMLSSIKSQKFDGIYLIAFSSLEFAEILKQAAEQGLSTHWYTYSGFETDETMALGGASISGVEYSYVSYSETSPQYKQFAATFRERYHSTPDIYTVTSYDALRYVSQALKSGAKDGPSLQKALREDKTFNGLFGPIKFGEKQAVQRDLIWKTVVGGRFSILTPQSSR